MRNKILISLGVIALVVVAIGLVNYKTILRFHDGLTLWTAPQQELVERFANWRSPLRPATDIRRAGEVMPLFLVQDTSSYPDHFALERGTFTLEQLFDRWGTTGFIAMIDDQIYDERYRLGHSADQTWMSFSASKSIVGMLVGIALKEGHIDSLDRLLTEDAPQLRNSAWDGVTYGHALDMTTGIRWNEDEVSFDSDLGRFSSAVAFGTPFDEWLLMIERTNAAPGERHNYASADTQALTTALAGAVGTSLSSYFEEKIWSKLGAEANAYWTVDSTGRELGLSGWNAVLRDYARLGYVYLNGKNWQGEQLIPSAWIESVRYPSEEFKGVVARDSNETWSSWHQAYVSHDGYGDFAAVGTYGQFIYVSEKDRIVIASHSVNPDPETEFWTLEEQFLVFRKIGAALGAAHVAPKVRSN